MVPWDSTAKLKAANDTRDIKSSNACVRHAAIVIAAARRVVWCAECGALQVDDGEWETPTKGGRK